MSTAALAQKEPGRNISVKITPLNNCTVYLGNYYGIGKLYADTALLDASGTGVFRGKKTLTPGMYFLISPKNKILTEFLLDSTQRFSIVADTSHLADAIISGSPENDLFKKYIAFASIFVDQTNKLNETYKSAKSEDEKNSIVLKQRDWGRKLDKFRDSIVHTFPKSLTALFLTAAKIPGLPDGMVVKTKADTLKAARYIKKHFWDDVPFNEDRLLYTPFFESKIDTYFNFYVSPQADSVIKDMQYMLLYARTGKEMYPYLLNKFTNRYYNAQQAGQNKVFLYLFNEFYQKGDTVRLSPQSKKLIFDRAYQLMANQVGDPAPALDMTSVNNKPISLYNINAPYTMIVFWDPSCTHCQKEIPRIDSMYRAKWKGMGLKLFSININAALQGDMVKFIADKHLDPDWIHAYQTPEASKAIALKGQLSYLQLYDVAETPTLYLLDDKKRIIAKGLRMEQMDTLMLVKGAIKK
ncbi:MAG: redoxin domain-containing protein [Mucilaginibacter sp.]